MGQADQGSGREHHGQSSMVASSAPVVEGVVGDEPSEGAIATGDGPGNRTAGAAVRFVVEAVAEREDMHFIIVQLDRLPHGTSTPSRSV